MHGHEGGWMWPMGGMMLGWLLLTALAVGLVVWLVMTYARPRTAGTAEARRILAERYARGELDTEDYQRRSTTLDS